MSPKDDLSAADPLMEFLVQLCRLLIESGVSLAMVQRTLQSAYLRSAHEGALLGNNRVNQSALAAITGLNRTKVRAILRGRSSSARTFDRMSTLVLAWGSDPEFLGQNGKPRAIAVKGPGKTFESLARKHGGDITPHALLRELERLRFIKVSNNKVTLTTVGRRAQQTKGLRSLSLALSQALEPPSQRGRTKSLGIQSAHIEIDGLSLKSKAIFRRRSAQGLQAFVSDLESAASAAKQSQRSKHMRAGKMSRLSVLLIDRQ
jgi:hypothetical protein